MKKITKRLLALLLVSVIMVTSVTTTAFAEEIDSEKQTEIEQQDLSDDTKAQEEPDADQADELQDEAAVAEMSLDDENDDAGIATTALTMGTKPNDGTTAKQPFSSGTGGSANFRIPALVTLSDGTLVAASDARWNHSADGYGLDTIVSYSTDKGANWNYTFANYLGDNGNVYNSDSTAFIDPALAVTKDNTIFMLVDLYPHGTYIGNVKAGTGFDSKGHLLLSANAGSSYDYYVGDFNDGIANIYQTNGTLVSGYTVDEHYNISGNGVNTNLFFSDSPYQVLSTSYLYLTKSTDGGKTWSAPMMLNSQVKDSSYMFYGVGPGRGLVTSTGRIIFPCYTYTPGIGDGNTSVIYSDDGGETWTRSTGMTSQSSEAALVEADGRIYMFTRHGGYYVSTNNGETWGNRQNVGITYNEGCQISAITYSEKIDGKTAILLSAPSSTSSRTNGKIFVGLVQDDGSIKWNYTYVVNNSAYQYSCLTELNDGSIGLLYEDGTASITYTNLAIESIAPNASIGEGSTGEGGEQPTEPEAPTKEGEITLYVGQSKTVKDTTGNYKNSYTGEGLDTTKATVEVVGDDGVASSVTYEKASVVCNTLIGSDSSNWIAASGYYYTADGENYYPVYAKRTSGSRYTKNYTWGYSTTYSTSNVTPIGTQSTITPRFTAPNISVYTKSGTDGIPASTTITFTGVSAGETSVVVGETRYLITVKDIPPIVDIDTTPFVANTGVGDGKKITKLTTSVGLTFDVDLNVTGSDIVWSIADTSIATVDQDGVVTGVKAGETTLTATVNGVAYTIPVVIRQDATSSSTKVYDFYLSEVTDTTVYMSISTSTDLIEIQEGEAIYISFNSNANTAVDFFGTPFEGYALTRMSSTNSAGDYMALNSTDPTQTDFYTKDGAAGKNQRNTFGDTAVANMVQAALDKDCDGGMGWTRPSGNTNGVTSDLTFRSEKLPTVEKEVATVNGVPYEEGMVAHVGEKVVFNITVTQYAAQDNITYSNVSLKDNLSGATFVGSSSNSKTITELSNTAVSEDTTHTYQVEYTIKDADLDTTIVNTVDLTYTYKSTFSSGSFGGTANADAKITAASFKPKDIVVDFGLPVTLDYSGTDDHGRYNLKSGSSALNVADVEVDDNQVTYTLKEVLTKADTVTLTNEKGGTYTFKVYPATSVYYEEGFASYEGSWSGATKGTGTQAKHEVGSKALYGYDDAYASATSNSGNSVSATSTVGDYAEFTFNGTGADIYALTTSGSGAMSMWLYDEAGTLLKLGYVDTHQEWLEVSSGNFYNTPVFSYKDLEAGTYKVVMKVVSGTISLDGFRVYNTQGPAYENIYAQDNEDQAGVVEIRDVAIANVISQIDKNQINDWYTYGENIIKAVYDATNNGSGAIILSPNAGEDDQIDVDGDMINNGPKNEIYLKPEQTIAMKIEGNAAKVAVGMRSLNSGEISYKINGTPASMTATVDMYHKVTLNNGMLVIENTGSNVIALTKLKATQFTGASNTALAANITSDADTVAFALMCIADFKEVQMADAVANINLVDYTGKVLATTSLTANGEEGSEATFAAADIQVAAEQLLPEGYAFVDLSAITDQTVVCGESEDVNVQIGKVATLKVTYKNLFGKTVGTATLTAVQTTSEGSYTFSASEIRKAAPSEYWTGTLISTKVKYGSTGTRTVIGF